MLTQRSKLPVLAPFLSLVACYCNLLGQVWQHSTRVVHLSDFLQCCTCPSALAAKDLSNCCMQYSVSCRQHILHACLLAGAPAFVI